MSNLASKPVLTPSITDTDKKTAFDSAANKLSIPAYLQKTYWWAYVHPRAVKIFEREWLVNLILFGNYAKLRNSALDEIGRQANGRTLQVACVYGDLTARLRERHASTLGIRAPGHDPAATRTAVGLARPGSPLG